MVTSQSNNSCVMELSQSKNKNAIQLQNQKINVKMKNEELNPKEINQIENNGIFDASHCVKTDKGFYKVFII